ncbi:hypothetical protein B0I00_0967 [Novosphingobium kunmingense]|uniref:DUF5801 domain-containing protein n=1 Tax=Novosphingobium kunmingense TaxID=1211806 RepID=A0A2N0I3L4_9SPHN|nr:DUF5801 repeats-in-toxin domain-containing protein [Novosphingobium kunmingense]PKB25760.1 hypothetical protein B0I00_0967 [Novosphingobium kunmingense]
MAITINVAPSLVLDETDGVQYGADSTVPQFDYDVLVGYDDTSNDLTSPSLLPDRALDAEFLTYIEGLFAADAAEDAALNFVELIGGASSSGSFITVTAGAGETVNNLYFSVSNGNGLITTVKSIANEDLYFHIDANNSDFATLTTLGGRIVAAFYLDEADNHLSAQVQMVTFEPLRHTDTSSTDEPINFSDVLQVSVASSTNFTFDNLPSGNFLYAAFGNTTSALLITGADLSVSRDGSKFGEVIKNDSDTVNTSQAAPGAQATIGINSQHFVAGGQGQNLVDGDQAVFTFVSGFTELSGQTVPATGTNVEEIAYSAYVNTNGAGIDISQLTGNTPNADIRISVWEADANKATAALDVETSFSYIDNSLPAGTAVVNDDTALNDDTAIPVFQVKVKHAGTTYTFDNANGNGDDTQGGVTVNFENAHTFTVVGLGSYDSVDWTAYANDTFNRVKVQALSTTDPFDLGGVHITQGTTSSVGVGSHLYVDDDAPDITAPGTEPILTVDDSNFAGDDTKDFSGVFLRDFGTDGQALVDPVIYSLGIGAGSTGLLDTLTGQEVVLSIVSGVVYGKVGTEEVFRVSVDGSGNVTLNQSRAVVHDDPDDHDESTSPAMLASDALITLSSTIKDRDGDTDSETILIGRNLNFRDAGPSITAPGDQPVLTVDETILGNNDSDSFASVFLPVYGNDGAAATPVTYALGIAAGPTGLFDTETGLEVVLSVSGGQVFGKVGALTVFVVSVDASGNVSLDQQRAVVHGDPDDPDESDTPAMLADDGLITLTATAHDKDGDSAPITIGIGRNIAFEDDGPILTAPGTPPELTVDESDFGDDDSADFSGVFSPDFGEDGEALSDATTYELGFNAGATGIFDTATDQQVVLSKVNGVIIGSVGTDEVFRVTVDGDGNVTLDQSRAVRHLPNSGPDQSTTLAADDLITLTATITDKDGDHDSETVGIARSLNFKDDAPVASLDRIPDVYATVDESVLTTNAVVPGASLLDPDYSYGADGPGTALYTLDVLDTGPTNLTTTAGDPISLVEFSTTEVRGIYNGNQIAFIVVIDPNNGSILLDQIVALYHPNPDNPNDSVFLDQGYLNAVLTVTDKDGDHDTGEADIGPALEFVDDAPTVQASLVNAPLLTVDESQLGTDDDAGYAAQFTPDYNNDGPSGTIDTTYALSTAGGLSGLTDTLTGNAVYLFEESGKIVGREGTSALDAFGGDAVFEVSVSDTGQVTLDQLRAIVHPTADPDEPKGLSGSNLVVLTATVTDGDGDEASAPLDLTTRLVFKDDGPDATLDRIEGVSAMVDETDLAQNGFVAGASLLTPGIDYGEDGAGSAGYTLDVTDAGPTNLTTTDLQAIHLEEVNSTTVRGIYGAGLVAFEVTIDALTGSVTLDQKVALYHPDDGDDDDSVYLDPGFLDAVLTVTDKDGDSDSDSADIGPALEFQDDGPSVTGSNVTVDVDDDGGAGGNDGGAADDDKLRVTQGSITALFDGGADGLADFTLSIANFDLNNPAPVIYSQGSLLLYHQVGDVLTGYVETNGVSGYQVADREVFTFELNVAGVKGDFEFTLIDQIDHDPGNDENNKDLQIGVVLQAVDGDGDISVAADNIDLTIDADDDSPVILTPDKPGQPGVPDDDATGSNDTITTDGATGKFVYAIGFDDREGTTYSGTNSDLIVTFASGTVFNVVGGTPIAGGPVTWDSEDETQATFRMAFSYVSDPGSGATTDNVAWITFDKDLHTYTFTLDDPILSYGVISLATASNFTGYLKDTHTVTGSQPPVTVAALASDFFVQFTGFEETGGGSDGKNAAQQASQSNNKNLDALAPGEAWSNGDDDNFAAGELFVQSSTWVSVSGIAAGTAGDTMQAGEVLDFNFYRTNPFGYRNLAIFDDPNDPGSPDTPPAVATTGTMFIEFDALDNGEDLVVVLKLVDKDNSNLTTTRAVIVQYQDIFHFAERDQIPDTYVNSDTIDQNDGLIVIESNDYNILQNDNWTIAGAQVVASTEGLSGQGINLNRAVGAGGLSPSTLVDFTTTKDSGGNNGGTWDGDVFKIVNIGFLTEITPDSQFEFNVQVIDFDGDASATQTLTIDIVGGDPDAAALAIVPLLASIPYDTLDMSPLAVIA